MFTSDRNKSFFDYGANYFPGLTTVPPDYYLPQRETAKGTVRFLKVADITHYVADKSKNNCVSYLLLVSLLRVRHLIKKNLITWTKSGL